MDFCKKTISPNFKFFFHLRASRTFDKFVCIARWKFLNFLPEDALEGKLNRKLGLVGFSPNSFGSILLNQVMLSFNYRLPSNSHKIPNMCQSKSQNQKMFTQIHKYSQNYIYIAKQAKTKTCSPRFQICAKADKNTRFRNLISFWVNCLFFNKQLSDMKT